MNHADGSVLPPVKIITIKDKLVVDHLLLLSLSEEAISEVLGLPTAAQIWYFTSICL